MPFASEAHHYDHYNHMANHQYQMAVPSSFHSHHASYSQPSVQVALNPINIHFQPVYQHSSTHSNASSSAPSSPIMMSSHEPSPKFSKPIEQQSTSSNVPMNMEELDEAADILLEINKSTPTCMGCGVSHTPAWRNGGYLPGGKKRLLCNACGLRYKRNRSGNSSS